ncbi:MAG: carboxypeptidase-like regulatory domain-containing protein [Candidatus Goldbacteria bacterium]|nr:carboxypeptidase-like regulatory domain-containing protein [Candidatus Goldiibacteriota bacterium]
MKLKNIKNGFTYIETMIVSVIVAFILLGSINLITRVYRGITMNQLKTFSSNLASENLEILKDYGFNALNVTPDSCLPNPLTNLEQSNCPSNPYPVETVFFNTKPFKVYKWVQYANEDTDGNIVPRKLAELGAGDDMNTKQITVVVAYEIENVTKTTQVTGLITYKEVPLAGSTISGRIYKQLPNGSLVNPGLGSNATVYFTGFPGYTTTISDDDGRYSVSGVMPGSYVLYASGLGMDTTYYANNPLIVTRAGSTITNVNFICPAIQGAEVGGRVYINITIVPSSTPTITFTPQILPTDTPITGTRVLNATGSMTGRTSTWLNPLNIQLNDGQAATGTNTNQLLYTEFQDDNIPNSVITAVRIKARIASLSLLGVTNGIRIHLTNNSGTNWADTSVPNGWTGTITTVYASWNYPSMLSGWVTRETNITNLYTTWDWAKVNSLGACFRHNTTTEGYMDYAYLEVDYRIQTPTPTQAPPTFTFTPTLVPTNTPIPCADGSIVKSLDGLSVPTVSAGCNYLIQNIDPTYGFTSISATFYYGGKSYYKYLTGVPVAVATRTYLDIWLEESTGVPTINGFVFDAINRTLPIVNASVYLSDPLDITATTSGGGMYTIIPANTGTWQLWASAPGYKVENIHTINVFPGINNAPNLYLYPVGNVSGWVTDEISGEPVSGISVRLFNSANTLIGSSYTEIDGSYIIKDVPAGSNYKISLALTSLYTCTYPVSGYIFPVSVIKGATTSNQNFRIKQVYGTIEGKVQIDGVDITDGILIIAYPSSVTYYAHNFNLTSSQDYLQGYTGRMKNLYPSYGTIAQRNANFKISVPLNQTYNLYAYYSYISYTGSVSKPVKTIKKYYKLRANVSPETTNNDFTGALSTWTEY